MDYLVGFVCMKCGCAQYRTLVRLSPHLYLWLTRPQPLSKTNSHSLSLSQLSTYLSFGEETARNNGIGGGGGGGFGEGSNAVGGIPILQKNVFVYTREGTGTIYRPASQ